MHVLSVNVSAGTLIEWQGRRVLTGIFKRPAQGRVRVHALGLTGDRQADLTVHGGERKAVYSYSWQNYEWWMQELGRELPAGMFGENLTIHGLDEETVSIGDQFEVGTVLLEAVQPRMPCYKLGVRFGDPMMVKRFWESRRFGTYFRVLREGDIGAGDAVQLVRHEPSAPTVMSLFEERG